MSKYKLGRKIENTIVSSKKNSVSISYPSLQIGSEWDENDTINLPEINSIKVGSEINATVKLRLKTMTKGKGNSYVFDVKEINFNSGNTKKNPLIELI